VLFSANVIEEPVQNGAKPHSPMSGSLVHVSSAAIATGATVAGTVTIDRVWGTVTAQLRLLRPL